MKRVIFSGIMLLFVGCGVMKPTVQENKQTIVFEYIPKNTNQPGSAQMVLAFLKPSYVITFENSSEELFQKFQKALGSDMEELIIAKGFTLKGPYNAFDDMIFDDKKRVEVAVILEISPQFTPTGGGWKSHVSLTNGGNPTWSYAGSASLSGKINMTGVEPLTHEKIWSKSVSIPSVENIAIATSTNYGRKLSNDEIMLDPSIHNAVGKALMTQYEGILDKLNAQFSVEELKSLQVQVKELKSKKGF